MTKHNKKAPRLHAFGARLTERALRGLRREAKQQGITLSDLVNEYGERLDAKYRKAGSRS